MISLVNKILLTALFFLAPISHAEFLSQRGIGKSGFLDLVMRDGKLDDSSIIGPMDSGVLNQVISSQKSKYRNFKESMIFAKYIKDGDSTHILSYDWTASECKYSYILSGKQGNSPSIKGDKVTQIKKDMSGSIVDSNSSVIDVKYCEKAYSFYSK